MPRRRKAPSLGDIAEQTRLSWARAIASYAAVPPVYLRFFEPLQAQGQPFPYTVLAPSYQGFLHRTTEKLLCHSGQEVHVLERSGNRFDRHTFSLSGISYVEVRDVLLDAHIRINGVTQRGASTICTLRFNSVTDYLFRPIVQAIRLGTGDPPDAPDGAERHEFDDLVRVNYKLMSYARRSLLPRDKVVHSILQPEIRDRLLTVFGRTYFRTVSPTHMTILTDREVIMIREEYSRSAEERYGGTWTYIPLSKIAALSLSEKGSGLVSLAIQLPEGASLEFVFEASAEPDLDRLQERFKALTA